MKTESTVSTAGDVVRARPFLKWAGGKTQLLPQITVNLPVELLRGDIRRYVEPFIGGGAVFFAIAQQFPLDELVIMDANEELVLAYTSIRNDVERVIETLAGMERDFLALSAEARRDCFYRVRGEYNSGKRHIDFSRYGDGWPARTAQMLFLNRTCYNGLFRVNAGGGFNVPFGRYTNPQICHAHNLRLVSATLQRTVIVYGDFESSARFVDQRTFVYFDPPYRPLSKTASFTAYSSNEFGDAAQLRLAAFYRRLDARGAKLMLSNSDPKNENPDDNFFDDAYQGFRIERVAATRMINSNAGKRGVITELLVMNY